MTTIVDELLLPNYEDSQYQNKESIGPQKSLPFGVQDIELSWDRKKGWMRIIIENQTWWFKEYLGRAQVLGTDNKSGRINLRALAVIEGETLIMDRDPSALPHSLVSGTKRVNTHNRLCYRRDSQDWRLRDENRPKAKKALVYVKSYVGDLNAEWMAQDTVAHIYHNGFTIVDDNHIAHLYDPLVDYS